MQNYNSLDVTLYKMIFPRNAVIFIYLYIQILYIFDIFHFYFPYMLTIIRFLIFKWLPL